MGCIAVLGANGRLGEKVMREALSRGHQVVAIVRFSLARIPFELAHHKKVEVRVVNVFTESSLVHNLRGCDVVISCLHFYKAEVGMFKSAMKCICMAMTRLNILRLIVISSWFTFTDNTMSHLMKLGVSVMSRFSESNPWRREMELSIEEDYNELDYTIVRVFGLNDGKPSGRPCTRIEGHPWVNRGILSGWYSSRTDVADFLIDTVENKRHIKKSVAIVF